MSSPYSGVMLLMNRLTLLYSIEEERVLSSYTLKHQAAVLDSNSLENVSEKLSFG